jgi:hypothetical protein
MTYILDTHMTETAKIDRSAALAFFLMENAGGIFGRWSGRMPAADQRALFGQVIGRGIIWIDGETEEVGHNVSVCFGTMRETVWQSKWARLAA